MIELATDYAKTREQLGVPIGSFQAVKHLLDNARVRLDGQVFPENAAIGPGTSYEGELTA